MLAEIEACVAEKQRLSREQAAWLFREASDPDLCRLASQVRARFHAPDEATYLMMAIINYTNVCVAKCDYCSFYRLPGQSGTYLLDFGQVVERVEALRALGGTLVSFNGGFHPELRIHDYAELFAKIHARFPELEFFEMTVAEFMFACKVSKIPYDEGARILKAAGTRWVTGGGAEVLDEAFRKRHSPGKYKVADYYKAQRAILDAELGSTATMVIGFGESLDERLNHLESLRTFQDSVDGKLASFLCWTYKSWGNELGGEEISTEEYLRWLAVSRLYLDNFANIQSSWVTQGLKIGQLALLYGANDMGSLMIEENVVAQAGTVHYLSLDEVRGAIMELGFTPRQRNVRYELLDAEHERRAIEANHARYAEIRAAQRRNGNGRLKNLVPLTIVPGDSTA